MKYTIIDKQHPDGEMIVELSAPSPALAGKAYATDIYFNDENFESINLIVRDETGDEYAVTVDAFVETTFDAYATKRMVKGGK